MEFWTQLLTRLEAADAAPDVLALSYYPEWHGSPGALEHNLHTIAEAFPEYALDVAETAYPAESWPPGDPTPLPNSPFPVTVQGQADAIQRVFQVANDVPGNRVQGVLVWEPANWQPMFTWVETSSGWFPEANASLDVYHDSDVTHVLEDTVHVVTDGGRRRPAPPPGRRPDPRPTARSTTSASPGRPCPTTQPPSRARSPWTEPRPTARSRRRSKSAPPPLTTLGCGRDRCA